VDNSWQPDPARAPTARFVPDRRYTAMAAAGALVALGAAIGTNDPRGRLLAAIAVLVLACYAVSDLVFSPRLEASAAGLRIRSPFARAQIEWSQVERVRVVSRMRGGLRTAVLEIDAGEVFVELSRRSLATSPEDAIALVLAFRPA